MNCYIKPKSDKKDKKPKKTKKFSPLACIIINNKIKNIAMFLRLHAIT